MSDFKPHRFVQSSRQAFSLFGARKRVDEDKRQKDILAWGVVEGGDLLGPRLRRSSYLFSRLNRIRNRTF